MFFIKLQRLETSSEVELFSKHLRSQLRRRAHLSTVSAHSCPANESRGRRERIGEAKEREEGSLKSLVRFIYREKKGGLAGIGSKIGIGEREEVCAPDDARARKAKTVEGTKEGRRWLLRPSETRGTYYPRSRGPSDRRRAPEDRP
ncbi:uncharacterized protein LOC143186649 [Calliopsis andreniformis]|uniref:uncharacterized protein LOC143186649 n=1 Tax=Calliopsis andreniformis TaxID=337506 RepID=UPI003FCE19E2